MDGRSRSSGDSPSKGTGLLEIGVEADDSYARVVPVGEIDRSTAADLDKILRALTGEKGVRRVVVDLAGVTFLDASGIHVLCKAADGARRDGFDFGVARPPHHLRRLLVMTGVDQFVHLVDR